MRLKQGRHACALRFSRVPVISYVLFHKLNPFYIHVSTQPNETKTTTKNNPSKWNDTTNQIKRRMVNTEQDWEQLETNLKICGSMLEAISVQVSCWKQGAIFWTHLSGVCVTSSSALSVCKSLLDAPTSPSCIFLKCKEHRNVMHCVNVEFVHISEMYRSTTTKCNALCQLWLRNGLEWNNHK